MNNYEILRPSGELTNEQITEFLWIIAERQPRNDLLNILRNWLQQDADNENN